MYKSFFLLFTFLAVQSVSAQPPEPPEIQVTGRYEASFPADTASLTLGVITENASASEALLESNQKLNSILTQLEKIGFTKQDVQTAQFQMQPVLSEPPKPRPKNFAPQVVAYRLTHLLTVRVDPVTRVGEAIDAATSAGANQVQDITFQIDNPEEKRLKAISEATKNAYAQATALASAAGFRVGRVLNARVDQMAVPYRAQRLTTAFKSDTPIAPSDVEVSANVQITYEIAP